jgi:hypothetical protein
MLRAGGYRPPPADSRRAKLLADRAGEDSVPPPAGNGATMRTAWRERIALRQPRETPESHDNQRNCT